MTSTEHGTEPDDPLANVRAPHPLVCLSEWCRLGRPDVGTCQSTDPGDPIGLLCTRVAGHPGRHIAEDGAEVVHTWPASVTL